MLDSEPNLAVWFLATQDYRFPSPIQDSEKQSDDFPAGVLLLRFLLGEFLSLHS